MDYQKLRDRGVSEKTIQQMKNAKPDRIQNARKGDDIAEWNGDGETLGTIVSIHKNRVLDVVTVQLDNGSHHRFAWNAPVAIVGDDED